MPWGKDQTLTIAPDSGASSSSEPWNADATVPQATAPLPSWGQKDAKVPVVGDQSLSDAITNFSAGAGAATAAGLQDTANYSRLALAGIPAALGDTSAADAQFAQIQAGREQANELHAAAENASHKGAIVGNVASLVPTILGGEAALPARIVDAGATLLPRIGSSLVRALPVAGTLGQQQAGTTALGAVDQGASAADAEKVFLAGAPIQTAANLIPAGLPGSPAVRLLTGAAAGAATGAGSQEAQHLISPDYVPAPTVASTLESAAVGGILNGVVGGGPAAKLDPYLQRYTDTAQGSGPARLELPAPDLASAAAGAPPVEPVAPVAGNPAAPAAPAAFDAKAATDAFHADPRAALDTLDHPTLTQLASDVGIDVGPNDKRVAIISKIAGQPKSFLSEDVLPEYLAAAQDAHEAAQAAPQAGPATPAVPTPSETPAPVSLADAAQSLAPGSTVPVDASGTAYTPAQGSKTLADAIDAIDAQMAGRAPALPSPVTTVDSLGNAIDTTAQNRQIQQSRADEQAGLQAAATKRELGITPDIERTQAPKWEKAAQDAEDRRLTQEYADDEGEMVGQRTDDAPDWWVAGQHAEDEFQQHVTDLAQARDAESVADRRVANDTLTQAGFAPEDHDEALTFSQLINRALDAGAEPKQILAAGQEPDSATRARALWALTNRLEGERNAQGAAVQQTGPAGGAAPPTRSAAAREAEPGRAVGSAEAGQAGESTVPERAGSGGERLASLDHGELNTPLSKRGITDAQIDRELSRQQADRETQTRDARQRGKDVTDEAKRLLDQIPKSRMKELGNPHGLSAKETRKEFLRSASTRPETTLNTLRKEAAKYENNSKVEEGAQHVERGPAVPEAKQRRDWTPKTDEAASNALDDIVQRYGGSTLADSFSDAMREHTTAQLVGQTIHSPEDLAALASVYRSPAFETMRYVYTDRDGLILGETAVSSRMPSSSVTFPLGETSTEGWINKNKPAGATKVWMIHNHPTADPRASRADVAVTQKMSIKLGDMLGAPKLAGHVILDHDTYGFIDALGENQGVHTITSKLGTNDPTRELRGDQRMFDVPVTSPEFAAITGKRIAAATPENSSAVVMMAADGTVNSIHTFPNDFLMSPKGAAMLGRIAEKRGATGIGLVTSTANFAKHRAAFDQAGERGLFRDAIVVNNEGHALRLNDSALFPKDRRGPPMSRSKAVYRRNDVGSQVMEDEASLAPISLQAVRRALEARGMSPEQIAGMSRDQLRTEQANLRTRSAPSPEQVADEPGITGIKNATKEEERGMKGKAAVEHDLSQTNPEQYARAKARFDADPYAGQDLAARVIGEKKAIDPEDSILLSLDAMRIINERQQAYEVAEKAMARGDEATRVAALSRVRQLDGQMEANDMAARYSGVRAGQILQARKVMIKADYSMARLVLRGKVAKGTDLTDAERSKLEKLAKEIDARSKALDDREAKLRAMEAEARPAQKKVAAKAKFNDLAAQLKAIAEKDQLKPGCVV